MKLKIFVLLLLLATPSIISAQKIGQIKDKAQQNTSESGGSRFNNSSGDFASNLFANIFVELIDIVVGSIWISPEERAYLQERRIEKREQGLLNPKFGLDIDLNYGGIPNDYHSLRPRARAHIGIFSTDIRYSSLIEKRLDGLDIYNTLDWQVLQIAWVNVPQFTFRTGFGIMYEYDTNLSYPEFTGSFDIYFNQQKIRFAPEFRYARGFTSEFGNVVPRSEINAELSYALLMKPHFKIYGGINALYARYYQSVNIWTVGAGLKLRVH